MNKKMKSYLSLLNKPAITLLSACVLSSCTGVENKRADKEIQFKSPPNIVLISLDDSNNWLGAWGGQAITPNIDKLASEGRLFQNSYCVAPVCNSSRTALLTGQRPETTGQWGNPGNFRELPGGAERITLPQYLRAQGYEAVAAGKIFHNPRGPAERPLPHSDDISWDYQWVGEFGVPGWDAFFDERGYVKWLKGMDVETDAKYKNILGFLRLQGFWGSVPFKTEECGDWHVMDFGVEYLKKDHDKPFFLALGTLMPHLPHLAPQKYFDMYPMDKIKFPHVPEDEMDDIPERERTSTFSAILSLMKEMGEYEKAVQAYLASTSFADACVGHFMDALNKSKYKDNTIVVFFSDHGFKLGHKERWAKGTLWSQSTHAPLAIRLPEGMMEPGITTTPVSFLDIFPTIVELAGLERPSFIEGNSLLPLLKDPMCDWQYPAIVTNNPGNYSIIFENWNYIRYRNGEEELYDHKNDPDEHSNLALDSKYREVMDRLAEWIPD
jgi:arylsulfatase A-like enzyme